MQSVYKAILHGDRIEWQDEVPEDIRSQSPRTVLVTILDQAAVENDTCGPRMAEALERLALSGGVPSIADASRWQREEHRDRDLPGRAQ